MLKETYRNEDNVDILRDSVVTTRKDCRCSACGRSFPKGTKMHVQINVDQGEMNTWRTCPTCQELFKQFRDHFFDDMEMHFPYMCVHEYTNRGETPEDLLIRLTKEKQTKPNSPLAYLR